MTSSSSPTKPALGLADVVSLSVGIIIGAAIFGFPWLIFSNVPDARTGMGLWVAGGAVALVGALVYAELASAYPTGSGEYVFLRRAYGPFVGFAFAWGQLAVIRTGASIAPIAYVFADYAKQLFDFEHAKAVYVTASIAGLTLVNALGIHPGRRTQNALTLAKVLGLVGVILAGLWLFAARRSAPLGHPPADPPVEYNWIFALVLILWAYSGWHEVAYVVADLRNNTRNFARAILLGVGTVTVIYLAVNLAYLGALGLEGVRQSKAVASEVLGQVLGDQGRVAMALLVVVSTLGAINGLILAGGRFFASFGAQHPGFGWLSEGRTRRGAPLAALIAQAAITLGMVALVETGDRWKPWVADVAGRMGVALPLDFAKPTDGFSTLVMCTAPVFWFFFLLTSVSFFVLRAKEPDHPRPFRVPLAPVVGALFCGACLFMLYQTIAYAISQRPAEAVVVVALLLAGLPVYFLARAGGRAEGDEVAPQNG
jgi:amino acid transporter